MQTAFKQYQNIFGEISANTVIITVNQRLALYLQNLYQQQNMLGYTVSPKQPIYALNSWLQELYRLFCQWGLCPAKRLLTKPQSLILFSQCIHAQQSTDQFISQALAREAYNTYQLMRQWQISFNDPALQHYSPSQTLLMWIQKYLDRCEEKLFIDEVLLPQALLHALPQNKPLNIQQKLIFIGFDNLWPELKKLLHCLATQNWQWELYDPQPIQASLHHYKTISSNDEMNAMAQWAIKTQKEHPNATIACVVHDLVQKRKQLINIFQQNLQQNTATNFNQDRLPLNFSVGPTLTEYPLIVIALAWITINPECIIINELTKLLLTPFIDGGKSEQCARAQLDKRIRELEHYQLSLSLIYDIANQSEQPYSCPKLCNQLSQLIQLHTQMRTTDQLTPSNWVGIFKKILTIMGWPGEANLTKTMQAYKDRFLNLLDEFATYDEVLNTLSKNEVLAIFSQLVQQTIYQPKAAPGSIQIIGLLEASGQYFDHLWVLGLNEQNWPASPQPSPFLPADLQRKLGMPHAHVSREYQFCQSITQRLSTSANEVIFSYAHHDQDYLVRASPLLKTIPVHSLTTSPGLQLDKRWLTLFNSQHIEHINDTTTLPFNAQEVIRGGSQIFKLQSLCPFRAQATLRWYAQPIEEPQPGLSAKQRGIIIHKSLELIWQQLQNQETLINCAPHEREKLIKNAVTQSLNESAKKTKRILMRSIYQLELKRLTRMLNNWLAYEETRRPFSVIHVEHKLECMFGELTVRMKLDRVDRLDDGRVILIDYKTGKPHIQDWFSERPRDPQLPLYTFHYAADQIAAIAFAQISSADSRFKGVAQNEDLLPQVKALTATHLSTQEHWEAQLMEWHRLLENLGQCFIQGQAQVDPVDQTKTCKNCGLQALCRVRL
jgi:probable DNA repair protein